MSTINLVEVELADDKWKITWDDARRQRVRTEGEKYGLKYTTYYIPPLTPSKAYDIAMIQLQWLKEDYADAI